MYDLEDLIFSYKINYDKFEKHMEDALNQYKIYPESKTLMDNYYLYMGKRNVLGEIIEDLEKLVK